MEVEKERSELELELYAVERGSCDALPVLEAVEHVEVLASRLSVGLVGGRGEEPLVGTFPVFHVPTEALLGRVSVRD